MTVISATRVTHPESGYPPHWVHYRLDATLTGQAAPIFRDLVVSHQTDFLGDPETVLLRADAAGQPLSPEPLRTVQDQHTDPTELVRHYLTRHATPG